MREGERTICLAQEQPTSPEAEAETREASIAIVRHLEDVNNLIEGRDNGLVPGQEAEAQAMTESVIKQSVAEGHSRILFIASPAKRTRETTDLMIEQIREQYGDQFKTNVLCDRRIRDLDEGKFVLPPGYQPGEHYQPLATARDIFFEESFGDHPNPLYRYGDPVQLPEGGYKYPELAEHFMEPGESQVDLAVRLYSAVLDMADEVDTLKKHAKLVVVSHGTAKSVFWALEDVERDVADGFTFDTGSLMQLCWERYNTKCVKGATGFGNVGTMSLNGLYDQKFIDALQAEVNYLQRLKQGESCLEPDS